jgi:hypothetical protein
MNDTPVVRFYLATAPATVDNTGPCVLETHAEQSLFRTRAEYYGGSKTG